MRLGPTAALLAVAACSSLSENQAGISALEVRLPANFYLEVGDTLRLRADAVDSDGAPVEASIVWRTTAPDTVATLDSLTGALVGLRFPDTARVQVALAGQSELSSDLSKLRFFITDRADTLELLSPDSVEVSRDADTTSAIDVQLTQLVDTVPVAGRPVRFKVVEPAQSGDSTVVFLTGRWIDSLTTSTTGRVSTVRLRAVRNRTPPDRVVIEVTAFRPDGTPIPGSGRHIVVRFLHQ